VVSTTIRNFPDDTVADAVDVLEASSYYLDSAIGTSLIGWES
jgi:hypothetical protein